MAEFRRRFAQLDAAARDKQIDQDAASGTLYSINPATGMATALAGAGLPYGSGPIHFGEDGGLTLAPAAAAPEPRTWALMEAGLRAVGGWVRRRAA